MRIWYFVVPFLWSLVFAPAAGAAPPGPSADGDHSALRLRVEGGGWGRADPAKIEAVLYSVADVLLSRMPNKLAPRVIITHTEGNPIAFYHRGPSGEYLVRLHASDERWHLYVFEFAHEFCHLLSNFDANLDSSASRHNQWFEESLCEAASLYALDALAEKWANAPAGSGWPGHAAGLRSFYDQLLGEQHRQLPPRVQPAAWLDANEGRLRGDPYQREKNDLVAKLLLPLFQERPKSWEAIGYLNLDPSDPGASLADYLRHWHQRVPLEHKSFVAGVSKVFGVVLPVGAAAGPATAGQPESVAIAAAPAASAAR
ncbi:MAG: hypothetical protein HZC22_18825 [Rhodocyclales bacterium]|nr:hypothetical protein [Rhodocyclales bacterium]